MSVSNEVPAFLALALFLVIFPPLLILWRGSDIFSHFGIDSTLSRASVCT
jgi:hypothetical protein